MFLLWLAGSAMAAMILVGAVHRRRSGLTDSLRGYVERSQAESTAAPSSNRQRDPKAPGDSMAAESAKTKRRP
jgi:hypothetical protein